MNKLVSSKFLLRAVFVLFAVFIIGGFAILGIFGPRYGVYLLPPSPQQYATDALNYMDFGIYASSDAWAAKKAEAQAKAANLSSYEEAQALLNEAVKVAGGKHSTVEPAPKQEIEAPEPLMPTCMLDEAGIMHITVPATNLGVASSYYQNTVAFMEQNKDNIKAAIVDLRDNTGGDMGPMVAAVAPLLPDGTLLSFHTPAWDYTTPVTLTEGKVEGGGSAAQVGTLKLTDIPIAILQNERTASSGEAVLLAFRGLPRTQSFGAPTAGYCSANSMRQLYDGATILLTTGTDVARTGEEFCEDPIAPDVASENPLEDARTWLLNELS